MVCVLALYPNQPGSRFDTAYYTGAHASLAARLLAPHGLTAIRATLGETALDGTPPPYWAASEMLFRSRADFEAAMDARGAELFADAANYTNVTPILQFARTVELFSHIQES